MFQGPSVPMTHLTSKPTVARMKFLRRTVGKNTTRKEKLKDKTEHMIREYFKNE
jgi:hypothetical protein